MCFCLKASYFVSHQSQSVALLEETERQIRERPSSEQLRRLKEARNDYREEVVDYVRHSTWYVRQKACYPVLLTSDFRVCINLCVMVDV